MHNIPSVIDIMNTLTFDTVHYDTEKIAKISYSRKSQNSKKENNPNYCILKYKSCEPDDAEVSLYRSLVLDESCQKVLSVAPPNGLTVERFREKYENIQDENITISQIVEGTMINLFYDFDNEQWEIATRGAVGGDYWFHRVNYNSESTQLTFREMFLEALGDDKDLNDSLYLTELPKDHCYSFVLQHPNNHIVYPVEKPTVYLVSVYKTNNDNSAQYIPIDTFMQWDIFKNLHSRVMFPLIVSKDNMSYDSLLIKDSSTGFMVVHDETGDRTALVNSEYERLKCLRGNNPNIQYDYFERVNNNTLVDYLISFPQYKSLFDMFDYQYKVFLDTVHNAYMSYYVLKQGKSVRIPKNIFTHIYKLHYDIYLKSDKHITITREVVSDYFANMTPKEKMYHVNYVDTSVQE